MAAFDHFLAYGYGIVVILGGLIAFLRTQSSTSLIMAGTTGIALLYAGFSISKPKTKLFGYRVAVVVTGILVLVMGYRFYLSGKFMPAGLVFFSSLALTVYNVIQLNQL